MSDLCVRHLLRDHREVEQTLADLESFLEEQKKQPGWCGWEREAFRWIAGLLSKRLDHLLRKEEEVLFPVLETFLPQDTGPLAVLREEHRDLQGQFNRFREAGKWLCWSENEADFERELERAGQATARLLRDHIYKEQRVLFPMVCRFLSRECDAELLARMEAIDRGVSSFLYTEIEGLRDTREGGLPMEFDKKEMIEKLKLEIEVLEKGGYYPSVREPRKLPRIFRDSVTCPNMGLEEKVEPCVHCFLIQFVPLVHLNKQEPCHFIPLNEHGDTVASLSAAGDGDKLHSTLLAWLKATVKKLEHEVAAAK